MELTPDILQWASNIAGALARRLPPCFDRQDLEQVARIEAWLATRDFDPSRGVEFRVFAYRRVRGAVLMSVRRRHWTDATAEELSTEPILPSERQPDHQVDQARRLERLRAAESSLPRRQQRVIEMHWHDGRPLAEVAARLGVTTGAVARINQEALSHIREALAA